MSTLTVRARSSMESEQIGVTALIAAIVGAVPIIGKLLIDFFKTHGQQRANAARLAHEGELKADDFALGAYREMFAHQLERMKSMEDKLDTVIAAEADCREKMAVIRAKAEAAESEAYRSSQLARSVGHRVTNLHQQMAFTGPASHSFFESTLDAVVLMDEQGMVSGWNPAASNLLGWVSGEIVGSSIERIMLPGDVERHRAGLKRYFTTGQSSIIGNSIRVSAVHKDGTLIEVELVVTVAEVQGTMRGVFTGLMRKII